jgi:hypothetical protein
MGPLTPMWLWKSRSITRDRPNFELIVIATFRIRPVFVSGLVSKCGLLDESFGWVGQTDRRMAIGLRFTLTCAFHHITIPSIPPSIWSTTSPCKLCMAMVSLSLRILLRPSISTAMQSVVLFRSFCKACYLVIRFSHCC